MTINVKEFRRHLADYLSRAEQGEEIVITRNDQPVARLAPTEPAPSLDLAELEAFHEELAVYVEHSAVLLEREEARY